MRGSFPGNQETPLDTPLTGEAVRRTSHCATSPSIEWYPLQRLSPGQTALDGLITARKRQKVVSRETADVVRVEDKLQPRCRRGRTWAKV